MSSVGVHNGEIPWTGNQAYGKNLRIQMGRCPVRSIFPQSLEKLRQKQHLLGFMSDKIMPLSEAVEGYDLFDKMKVQKGKRPMAYNLKEILIDCTQWYLQHSNSVVGAVTDVVIYKRRLNRFRGAK